MAISFAQLAQQRLQPLLKDVSKELLDLPNTAAPDDDQLGKTRRDLLMLRTQLDVFSYAFAGEADEWKAARKLLDQGYESLGHYKDLGSKDAPEAKKLQGVVTAWEAQFGQALPGLQTLLANTELGEMSRKGQSKLLWGGIEQKPSDERDGIGNLRVLVRAQLKVALESLDDVLGESSPVDDGAFHEFRKRVRCMNMLMRAFPELGGTEKLSKKLDAIVNQWGDIEDKVVKLQLAKQRGQDTQAIKKDIAADWDTLHGWVEANDVKGTLKEARALLKT